MPSREQSVTAHDGPLESALAEYFDRLDRGEHIELTTLIAAHPGCEDGLRKFFNQERRLHDAVSAATLTAMPHKNLAGRMLGDFRLTQIIGRGGMGVVWEAEQISLRRKVAVKLLPGAMCSDLRHRTRFQNEARILAQLEHPNIVNVIAVGEAADAYYFAMQYVDGITADNLICLRIDERPRHDAHTAMTTICGEGDTEVSPPHKNCHPVIQTTLPISDDTNRRERFRQCARIGSEIAQALAHAHACGVLHRDVKPSNILLDRGGTARLTDFGLARMYGEATLTATGVILGTLRYASPEQLSGNAAADERSDVYSLGATLWELVTGQRLFATDDHNAVISQVLKSEAPRPSSLIKGLPRDLETIIVRAMAKEPTDRYVSAEALADDLQRFLDGRPIRARRIPLSERAFRWANRNRALAIAAVSSLLVLTSLVLVASALILRANSRTAVAVATGREMHYAADMISAGAALKNRSFTEVRAILERYAQPSTSQDGATEEDLRGFECISSIGKYRVRQNWFIPMIKSCTCFTTCRTEMSFSQLARTASFAGTMLIPVISSAVSTRSSGKSIASRTTSRGRLSLQPATMAR
jgi:serine/threonine protein kinase